jgi:quercetin dioxygenase-like cupin family protein
MDTASLRDHLRRDQRLDEKGFHLFALDEMIRVLRSEDEFDTNGHTGVTLIKTTHLRVVLEAARAGTRIGEHEVPGPTIVHVLEGTLRITSEGEEREAHAGEMVVIPHSRPGALRAETDAAFFRALSMDEEVAATQPEGLS